MRSIRIITTLALLLTWATAYAEEDSVSAFQTENDDNTERLWYDTPAKIWLEALPIGNGRLGGMVYGGPQTDEIQLNEDSFWSGGPHNNNSTTSAKNLDKVRNLIFSGKEQEAENLINQQFIKGPHGMKYLSLGSLKMAPLPSYRLCLDARQHHCHTLRGRHSFWFQAHAHIAFQHILLKDSRLCHRHH